ncbi:unnamed protein product [Orchesella dallaii]|uniref:E2F-associated phosphoprotein n=1 Tax=Orchesella dallaii TaxID=48710 RepID=A0ABP1QE42_9HEXA
MDYLDFGSSDSEQEEGGMAYEMDSDEEERYENKRLLKMFELHTPPSKNQRNIQDFEAEMEAELDRRAFEVETQGGMEHQKSLSRSSSTNSLNKSPRASPVPGSSSSSGLINKKSCLKRRRSHSRESKTDETKSVKFALPSPSPVAVGEPSPSAMETSLSSDTTADVENLQIKGTEKKAKEMYDELYFDSDESDGEENSEKKQKKEDRRRFMTDEELFYDPSSDAKDQAWIDNQRRKSYGQNNNASSSTKNSNHNPSPSGSSKLVVGKANENSSNPNTEIQLPTTDAILNCPACFTTVCHDCQRHEVYVGQYRAMFVMNCLINTNETLTVPEKPPKKYRKRKKGTEIPGFTPCSSTDVFNPVMCKVCKTQVAMYDSDEIYHFFNVLASQP